MPPQERPGRYPAVPAQPDYARHEEETLSYWLDDKTFEASVAGREGAPEFVFYDGPPFANGLPHYGHLLTGFVKDAIPRYQTMRGHEVERRFGWDCHGLPAELEAQKELGVSGHHQIVNFGIDRFNDYCRTSVLRYTKAWESYVTRQGRWVDFANDYKTMDLTFMESVLWAFKELHRRELIYEGRKVLPYCWECETPLSNFETRSDDSFRERIDPAVTVAFDLLAEEGEGGIERGPLRLLVWTTTPWTLPSNLALAVGPDLAYTVLRRGDEHLVVGSDRLEHYRDQLGELTVVTTMTGADLIGRRYRPLFPYFREEPNAFVVVGGDFVSTDEGTGIVHLAPGFGEDDQRVCEENQIAVVCPVDDRGRFESPVVDFAGEQVFDANERIIERLAEQESLIAREEYAHSYPHCWRSDTPLIYRAVRSYFVNVTAVKDRMLELNREITWVPGHIKDGSFGKWLEGARDWAISRNRFWGTPIPVWQSDDPAYPRTDVYGSLDEIEADFGVRPTDLHRPAIDELTRPNPDDPTGGSVMRRVSDVLDCWFESGSMPFAQLHYPFENQRRFEENFPADFIVEYVGQVRCWFYTLHVLATALFDRPAFKSCIAHGVVLGDDGRKLSKRLRNFPDPEEFFAKAGADSMRWYLLSAPVLRGLDVAIEEQAMSEPIRRVLNPLWNTWYFLALYGESDGCVGESRADQTGVLDRYVLAKTRALVESLESAFDAYDLAGACGAIEDFLEALTNWYVRRSRERFWRARGESAAADADKRDAYDTLHTVLEITARAAAPLLPFLTEEIYRGLTGARSVHLTDWPDVTALPDDRELVATMDFVREVCSAAHSIRKANGKRARLPLRSLLVAGPGAERLGPFVDLIKHEVNVKEVRLQSDASELASNLLTVIPAALGPRLGALTQQVIAAVRAGRWEEVPEGIAVAGAVLSPSEYNLVFAPRDEQSARVLASRGAVVALDLESDPELDREGRARDVVRLVQQARRDEGLNVADRILLELTVAQAVAEDLADWTDEIAAQTLAAEVTLARVGESTAEPEHRGRLADGEEIGIRIERS